MTTEVINKVPFLKKSRIYPKEINSLSEELNITYVDVANAVNDRTIGLFPTNRPAINGEAWFLAGITKQQALRQVYTFESAGAIPHGINFDSLTHFTKCYGAYTDDTNWYGLIFGSSTAIAGQVSFYIDSTNIVILADGAAPSITKGIVIIEWISNP